MALININVDGSNMVAVNGKFTFTTNFYNKVTGELTTDNKFPQNQVYETTSFVEPFQIPVSIADGSYTVENIEARVRYKEQTVVADISGLSISCNNPCISLPINSVSVINNSTLAVSLSGTSSATYNWRVLNSSQMVVATGTSNTSTNNFTITIPTIPSGNYILELVGSNCTGKSVKSFQITSATLPDCPRGPIIQSVLSANNTTLQFQFDGDGVFAIKWRIKKGSNVLRNGVLKHTSIAQTGDTTFNNASPTITYSSLPQDTYSLEIEGELCKSDNISTANFTVTPVSTPLAFLDGSPYYTGTNNNFSITTIINKTGTYKTTILNTTTGVYYHNADVSYINNQPFVKTGLPSGDYIVIVGTLQKSFTILNNSGGRVQPIPFKTKEIIVNNRIYTYTVSSGMDIKIDPVTGTLSDVTPGIITGTPNKLGDKNLFYMIGYSFFINSDTRAYLPFKDVYLTQGVYTIRRYSMLASKIPTQADFESRLNGYPPETGVNMHNGFLNEMTLSIIDL